MAANREYRDRLFKFIFGNPENKEWTLSLYNAVNGSDYKNADDIIYTTVDNVVYMHMKNDVSFLVDNCMNFYEQQSTINPNMPMRFLIYAGMVYTKYIDTTRSYHQYSSKQQKAPTPKCICFYNGTANADDVTLLRLSDAFGGDVPSDIEVLVTMMNINSGHNTRLLESCRALKEYSGFMDMVRHNSEHSPLEGAVDRAINDLPDDALIKPFLLANRSEVKYMCITEYDEERTRSEDREEWLAEGRAEGRAEGEVKGRMAMLADLVRDGIFTIKQAAERAGMTVPEFETAMKTITSC